MMLYKCIEFITHINSRNIMCTTFSLQILSGRFLLMHKKVILVVSSN